MPDDSCYSIRDYGVMVDDRRRTEPYIQALRRAVRPGDVVVDIGTGSGVFAFVACQLGAARVYAIESSSALEVAKLCAANNVGSERITWLQGFSTELVLPEQADVVIGDLHGLMPFYNANIESLIDARSRFLKPGGILIPGRDLLYAVPAQAPHEYECVVSPWHSNDYGVDLRAGQTFVSNSWWRAQGDAVLPENLLAVPCAWGDIDYLEVQAASIEKRVSWAIERSGTMHGYYIWFDTEFGDGIALTNTPLMPGIAYGRAFFPLERAVEVMRGDQVATRLSARIIGLDHVFQWDTRITDTAGKVKAEFRQNSFNSRPFSLEDIKRGADDYVPALNIDGLIDLTILEAMSQCQPLGQIANDLTVHFQGRFASTAAALNRVAQLSTRFTSPDRPVIPKN